MKFQLSKLFWHQSIVYFNLRGSDLYEKKWLSMVWVTRCIVSTACISVKFHLFQIAKDPVFSLFPGPAAANTVGGPPFLPSTSSSNGKERDKCDRDRSTISLALDVGSP